MKFDEIKAWTLQGIPFWEPDGSAGIIAKMLVAQCLGERRIDRCSMQHSCIWIQKESGDFDIPYDRFETLEDFIYLLSEPSLIRDYSSAGRASDS